MLSKVYAFRMLDCVVESAVAISSDFYMRPNHYGQVDRDVAEKLRSFRSRIGAEPSWPDFGQREAMYSALFGPADGDSAFSAASQGVLGAATNYAEGAVLHGSAEGRLITSAGEPALRQAFVDALFSFEGVLSLVSDTAALKIASEQLEEIFGAAVEVLQSEHVARAFGVAPAPRDWPLTQRQSGKGAFLVERVSKQLAGGDLRPVTLQRFLLLQRMAVYGGKVIGHALGGRVEEDVGKVVQDAYGWASASNQLATS
jgi:hypothetical protein